MKSVFVSYSRADLGRAQRVVTELRACGLQVFWDRELRESSDFRFELEREIRSAGATVVLWSRSSVHSSFTTEEAELALQVGNYVPVLLEAVQPPLGLRGRQYTWLDQWCGGAEEPQWRSLLAAIANPPTTSRGNAADAFRDLPEAPLMVPFDLTSAGSQRRVTVADDFIRRDALDQWGGADNRRCAPALPGALSAYATTSLDDALRFIAWLSAKTGRVYRLISEEEYMLFLTAPNGTDIQASPKESLAALRNWRAFLWTWVTPSGDASEEVGTALGGSWLTPGLSTLTPRMTLPKGSRLPLVGIRVATDLEV